MLRVDPEKYMFYLSAMTDEEDQEIPGIIYPNTINNPCSQRYLKGVVEGLTLENFIFYIYNIESSTRTIFGKNVQNDVIIYHCTYQDNETNVVDTLPDTITNETPCKLTLYYRER